MRDTSSFSLYISVKYTEKISQAIADILAGRFAATTLTGPRHMRFHMPAVLKMPQAAML